MGRAATGGAAARVGVDARELRPGAESRLLGDRRDRSRARKGSVVREKRTWSAYEPDARNQPDTGSWSGYFQHLPRDNWDLDHPFERMIVETRVAPDPTEVPWISPRIRPGETRRVITGIPGKTGVIWTLDARTGSSCGRGRRFTRTS